MTTTTTDTPTAFEKSTLDNGLRIVTSEMPHTRSVSISIFVGVGSRYESEDEAGISHFIEHLVFKGTERRPDPIQISGAIERTGAIINAGTEQEMTVYWCKVAEPHFQDALDLLIDMLRNPLLEEESTERERMVVIDELSMINDYPNYRVDTLIDEMLAEFKAAGTLKPVPGGVEPARPAGACSATPASCSRTSRTRGCSSATRGTIECW